MKGNQLKRIDINIDGMTPSFATARKMTGFLAAVGNPHAALVTWFDKEKNQHWPEDVGPDTEEFKGWQSYGMHHGGRLEIHVNDGQYIMVYS